MTEEWPQVRCPECQSTQDDMDGFGVLYCEKCGYCAHASINDERCDFCEKEVRECS